jgi:hypothetical protein
MPLQDGRLEYIMKCIECGADLYDGVKKCPYCKTPTGASSEDGSGRDFDIKYTISFPEELKAISGGIKKSTKGSKPSQKKGLFPNIRRIQKKESEPIPERREKRLVSEPIQREMSSEEKAKAMAKTASQRAAEFVPEGLARYTIRGVENPVSQKTESFIIKDEPQTEYKRANRNARVSKTGAASNKSSARNRRSTKSKKPKFSIDKKVMIKAGAVMVLAVAVIFAMAAIISSIGQSDKVASSYTYIKDNALFMSYNGKTSQISEQVICDSYLRYAEETESALSPEKIASSMAIVKTSKDKKVTYFFENFDPETESGTLKFVRNGKTKKVVEVSPAVHNSIMLSQDGNEILYLKTADENGDMGVLYYWNRKLDEPFKIATDIDHGTFNFAADGKWAMFIQNLNRVEMKGDLYAKSLDNLDEEKVKVDADVCKVYGTNPGRASYIYAKDYDKDDKSFDIYGINKKGRSIRLGERTLRDPLMQKTKNSLFVYGLAEDGSSNLYSVDINSGKKEKIASGVSSILMLSKNEKVVIYDKVYKDKLADYYAYTKGNQPQVIARNVVVDYDIVANKPQMAVDSETTKILYISEFEALKKGGTLNLCTYKKGKILSEEQIAEDVYAVYRGVDGKFIIAKDFSSSRKIFDVYLLDGTDLTLIKEEVSPEMFEVSISGDSIYCISDFGVEGNYGRLEKVSTEAQAEPIAEGVFDFNLSSTGDLLLYKNLNTEDGSFDLDIRMDGKRTIMEVDASVDEIIGF